MGRCSIVFVLTVFVTFNQNVIARSEPLKIINGTTADEGEFPYMVQLYDRWGYYICGGSILGAEWILTAAHCTDDPLIRTVIYGTNTLNDSTNTIKVKNWFLHPNYQTPGKVPIYDVALLQLEEPLSFNEKVQPIQLAESNDIPFHVQGVLTGWGNNATGGKPMEHLQKINLQLLTDEECTKEIDDYDGSEIFNATHNICTDNFWSGQCSGDSGSPFVLNGVQYGIVAWSPKPCGITPGVYSRVTNPEYLEWIKNVTNI